MEANGSPLHHFSHQGNEGACPDENWTTQDRDNNPSMWKCRLADPSPGDGLHLAPRQMSLSIQWWCNIAPRPSPGYDETRRKFRVKSTEGRP